MDYEKKYKNALTIAQSRFKIEKDESVLTCLGMMFPELRESEDERIRKFLITITENLSAPNFEEVDRKRVLAWLEKQKEQKNEFHLPPDFGMAYYNPKPIKQKEQKPAEWSDSFEEAVADLIEKAKQGKCDSLSPIEEGNKLLAIAKHGKVNQQEWSEKDETIIEGACATLENYGHTKLASMLKSLRPQPKQEWSEEDKNVIETLIRELRLNAQFEFAIKKLGLDYIQTLTVLDKCRRLHPSPSWKPSEEQMKALEVAFRKDGDDNYRNAINSLYNDLKKL